MRSDIGNSKNGYQVRKYNDSVKRYCQTLDLKDNPELIEEYVNPHGRKSEHVSEKSASLKWKYIYIIHACL